VDTDALRVANAGTLGWSRPWQSRLLRYTKGGIHRIVWFEDGVSTAAKLDLATRHHLRGVALWRIGGEDPRTWRVLEAHLGTPATS
jgi:spore germination protein YaaH